MVPQQDENKTGKTDTEPKKQSPNLFWYSLDVFAPAIELGVDKAWQPDTKFTLGKNYAYIHRIAGWILVPLILAALTGIIH